MTARSDSCLKPRGKVRWVIPTWHPVWPLFLQVEPPYLTICLVFVRLFAPTTRIYELCSLFNILLQKTHTHSKTTISKTLKTCTFRCHVFLGSKGEGPQIANAGHTGVGHEAAGDRLLQRGHGAHLGGVRPAAAAHPQRASTHNRRNRRQRDPGKVENVVRSSYFGGTTWFLVDKPLFVKGHGDSRVFGLSTVVVIQQRGRSNMIPKNFPSK